MGRTKRFKKRSPQRRGRVSSVGLALDVETLRDTIGKALYDRVMLWNDSGAAEALQVAEQRRKAKEIKKPCWVPKLNDNLYIGPVDWNMKESEEVCTLPKSAVAYAGEFCGEPSNTYMPLLPREELEQGKESSPALELCESSSMWYDRAVLDASIDAPLMVDAVLENCADGLRLLVGGWPVEPTGWDEVDSEFLDGPCVAEAVLEDFGDGQRLLVGGWPVQPSWDELDTNWSQLGWDRDKSKCCEHMHADRSWKGGTGWYPGNGCSSLYQGRHFMTAF